MPKKITLLVSLLLTLLSVKSFSQDEGKVDSLSKSSNTSVSERVSAKEVQTSESENALVLVYHNNNPSDELVRDFIWSLEGYSNETTFKVIISKLQLNSYLKNIVVIESGIDLKKFLQFSLTSKYDENKIFSAFEAAGVLYKKALDQSEVKKIKE